MLNYKVRARTQNFDILCVEARAQANWKSCCRGGREGYGHLRGVLQGGAWCAHRSTKIIVRACHLDGEGLRTLLGAAGGHLSPSWVDLGEAVVGFVGKYLGTADCEVARNQATGWFGRQKPLKVYYANKLDHPRTSVICNPRAALRTRQAAPYSTAAR